MHERVVIEEGRIPATLDGPDGASFREMVDVRNAVEAAAFGTDEYASTAEEILPGWLNSTDGPRRLLLARVDGRIVGRGVLDLPAEPGSPTAFVSAEVLPDFRDAGIGTALLTRIEEWATEADRTILKAFVTHGPFRGGRALRPPTGFGRIDSDAPEVSFAQGRGYRLEQVERMSRLDVADTLPVLASVSAEVGARATGYTTLTVSGALPDEWLADMVVLQQRMSTDAPAGGLDVDEEVWDTDRVRRMESDRAAGGQLALTTVARHDASGRLVAFTELLVPTDRGRPVLQDSTLVLSEHRGHRLGMLVKATNLLALRDASPASTTVTTYNAEENRPMLSVNEALGFRPIGAEGGWRKDVSLP
ncbi:GNAT family N-acetyltransferase [Labedella endophytica]|uniref:GNAT family N-acetyltransferase n=1 Tax=Labedella endophytica TaxID=1523160 RepID=UPI00140E0319|nr:GNAT family N-acetyltransferase [Labedella endophytica]